MRNTPTLFLIFLLLLPFPALSQFTRNPVATVVDFQRGITSVGTEDQGKLFISGDRVYSGLEERKTIQFRDGSMVRMYDKSTIHIKYYLEANSALREFKAEITLEEGTALFIIGNKMTDGYIETPHIRVTDHINTIFLLRIVNGFSSFSIKYGSPSISNRVYGYETKAGFYAENIGYSLDFQSDIREAQKVIRIKSNINDIQNVIKTKNYQDKLNTNRILSFNFSAQLSSRDSYQNISDNLPVLFLDTLNLKLIADTLNPRGYLFKEFRVPFDLHKIKGDHYFGFIPDNPSQFDTVGEIQKIQFYDPSSDISNQPKPTETPVMVVPNKKKTAENTKELNMTEAAPKDTNAEAMKNSDEIETTKVPLADNPPKNTESTTPQKESKATEPSEKPESTLSDKEPTDLQ